MPNKTIYVRPADIQLFERAQDELGESVSSLFAEFLKERIAKLSAQEKQALELVKKIRSDKAKAKADGVSKRVLTDYDEAEGYARHVLKYLRSNDMEAARNVWIGAQSYHAIAEQHAESYKKLAQAIDEALGLKT